MNTKKRARRAEAHRRAGRTLVPADILRDFCARVFRKVGVSAADARIAADVIVEADLRGIDSHGVARLRRVYISRITAGVTEPRPEVKLMSDTPVAAVLDGGRGLGAPTARRAMVLAIRKARRMGAGFVAVRNSNHFGIAGYYAMMALERDCVGLCMTNSNCWVVPTFGRTPMLGTNPIAVAAPAGRERPFVLDMATSAVSIGKLEVYDRLGRPIPPQWAADERGVPTDVPGAVLASVKNSAGGGLFPLGGAGEISGGHKGYGLGLWVDIFSALFSGGAYADQIHPGALHDKARAGYVSHFFGAWRVDAFRPLADFRADLDALLRRLKASPKARGADRIYVAGEKEFEEAERRRREGIPLPRVVLSDLRNLGLELGVAPIA